MNAGLSLLNLSGGSADAALLSREICNTKNSNKILALFCIL
jgi:hypothetical protein